MMRFISIIVLSCLCLLTPRHSEAFWSPGLYSGYELIPVPKQIIPAGSVTVSIEFIHLWEHWDHIALGVSAGLESNFATRATLAPRFLFEYRGVFRLFTGPVLDFGNPYALFAWRQGASLGYRTTGRYKEDRSFARVKGGAFLFVAVDYRLRYGEQETGPEWRFLFGARIETEL